MNDLLIVGIIVLILLILLYINNKFVKENEND